ncbi:hypothetical protein ABZP36_009154 [Zizania latifolia]
MMPAAEVIRETVPSPATNRLLAVDMAGGIHVYLEEQTIGRVDIPEARRLPQSESQARECGQSKEILRQTRTSKITDQNTRALHLIFFLMKDSALDSFDGELDMLDLELKLMFDKVLLIQTVRSDPEAEEDKYYHKPKHFLAQVPNFEAFMEEIARNGKKWMSQEVMVAF